jgi:hypothetical protein
MKRGLVVLCVVMCALLLASCSKEENTRSIVATVVKKEKPDPYTYRLVIRIELSDNKAEALKPGQQIAVSPNYIYVAPSLLDMSKARNHSLMELAKMNPGERLNATVAPTSDGSWMLIDGKRL